MEEEPAANTLWFVMGRENIYRLGLVNREGRALVREGGKEGGKEGQEGRMGGAEGRKYSRTSAAFEEHFQ